MDHERDLLEGLSDEDAHSKCLQSAFEEVAEEKAEGLSFSAEKGQES